VCQFQAGDVALHLPQFVQLFGKQQGVCRLRIAEYQTGKLRSRDGRVKSRNGVEGVEPMSSQFGPKSHQRSLSY